MESYSNLTDTELLHEINMSERDHQALKDEITRLTLQIEEYEKSVNNKLIGLETIEKTYVDLMKEMTSREK